MSSFHRTQAVAAKETPTSQMIIKLEVMNCTTSASVVLLTCRCQIKQLSNAILVSERKLVIVTDYRDEEQPSEGAMNQPSEGEHESTK